MPVKAAVAVSAHSGATAAAGASLIMSDSERSRVAPEPSIAPNEPEPLWALAEYERARGELDAAAAHLAQLVQIDPSRARRASPR